ncbi:hypothetical protein FACS189496_2990 [Bacilli bacterium]|nr:hypothetical protein FACS189496_2990 [Bacilli bacterium]
MLNEEPMESVAEEVSNEQVIPEQVVEQQPEQEPVKRSLDEIIADASKQLQEKEVEQQQPQQVPQQEAKPFVEVPKIDPMSFWNQQQKALFNSMNPDAQKQILDMFRNPAKAYDKSTQYLKNTYESTAAKYKEVEPLVTEYQTLTQKLEPLRNDLQKLGVNNQQFFEGLVEDALIARDNPIEFLDNFFERTHIDPHKLVSYLEDYRAQRNDPYFQKIDRVERWVKDKTLRERQEEQRKQQEREAEKKQQEQIDMQDAQERLKAFAQEVDEQGNPKHPYYDAVVNTMGNLSQQTNSVDLEDLYNQAIWLNPEIRSKLIEMERQTALQQQMNQTRVSRAKQAAKTSIKSSPSDSVVVHKESNSFEGNNLEQIIKRAAEQLANK